MATKRHTLDSTTSPAFPALEVAERLVGELQPIADESAFIRPEWVPLLDSQRVVGTVLTLEDLFPFKIPPDKVVRKGGYNSVDEAITDMLDRLQGMWAEHNKRKVRK